MKRLQRSFVVLCVMLAATGAAAGVTTDRPRVWAFLNNEAEADQHLLDQACAEATRLYAAIDIDLIWVAKVPGPDTRLHVISLVTWEPGKAKPPSVLGYTVGSPGRLAYVFLRRVERVSQRFKARVDNVLAVSIAHELGHMLLPRGSHARTGLMRPHWDDVDLRSASAGMLLFANDTADLIRRGQLQQTAAAAVVATARTPAR
jgi:hypothetical protein